MTRSPGRQRRIGIYLPTYHSTNEAAPTARFLSRYARRIEELGFDSIWVIDHLFTSPPAYRVAYLEPVTALTVAAAATERVRLGTGIIVMPLRHPVILAKEFATLDAMSEGRVIFGGGLGWSDKELEACQIDRKSRAQRMDEMLDIMIGLWTNESFAYHGRYYSFSDVSLQPRPDQRPRPPIWLSGGTVPRGISDHVTQREGYQPTRSLWRTATVADGLMSAYRSVPYLDTSYLKRDREMLNELAEDAGRDPSSLVHTIQDHMYISMDGNKQSIRSIVEQITYRPFEGVEPYMMLGTPDEIVPRLQARYDAGIDEILINFLDPNPEQLELFAEHIAPKIRN